MSQKVIGFTGAHNTGKSYLLRNFAEAFVGPIVVDLVSAPRSVQAQYGRPLAEIIKFPEEVHGFQDRILTFKREHLDKLKASNAPIILTDRSPIDFVAYAELWIEENDMKASSKQWLEAFKAQALIDLQTYDHIVFLPVMDAIPFVEESGRGSHATQQRLHELCAALIEEVESKTSVTKMDYLDIEHRVAKLFELTNS